MHLLSVFSLRNRALIALVTIVVAVFGSLALTSLKQELIPSVSFPQLVVVTAYPGAAPEVVNEDVSTPIETAIQGVPGLEGTTATSRSNVSTISASFVYGTDLATAEQKVGQAINRIKSTLPADVDPQVITGSIDDLPVIQIAVTSDLDPRDLTALLEQSTLTDIQGLEGVREASLLGTTGQRLVITPDRAKLAAAGTSQSAITDALDANGLLLPAGELTEDGSTLSVQAGSRLESADAIGALPLAGVLSEAGDAVTIADVAKVALEDNPVTGISRVDGEPALTIAVTKTPAGNTVAVSQLVQDAIPGIEDSLGDGTKLTVVFDQAPFIQQSIESLATEGILGLVFAVIVILVFLLSIRSTLVTAISIPASVLITFIGMQAAGYSLNIITLGALTIAIGRVVDDSIVVIENIKRHIGLGEDKLAAIQTAVKEVAAAITASTVTTVAVFLPLALVGDITGELFRPFALTVTIALAASLFVSLTIVPVLAFWFLGRKPEKAHAEEAIAEADADANSVDGASETAVPSRRALRSGTADADLHELDTPTRLQKPYLPILNFTLKRPAVTILAALLVLGGTVAMVPSMKTNFIGDSGQNTLTVSQKLPLGASLEAQDAAATTVEDALRGIDGITTVQTSIGSGGSSLMAAFGGGGGISFSLVTDPDADQEALQATVRDKIAGLDDVGEVSLAAAGSGFASTDISVDITATNQSDLADAADAVLAAVADLDVTAEASSNLAVSQPYIGIVVDRNKAAKLGLSELAVGGMVSQSMLPRAVGTVVIDEKTMSIYVDSGTAPATEDELRDFAIPTATGLVPLSELATVEKVDGPASITTIKGVRAATVSVTPNGDDVGTASTEIQTAVDSVDLPAGAKAELGGVTAQQGDAFTQLGLALLVAILIVYVVMVATFKSLRQPLLLLVSVPFAATGAIALQVLSGVPLGVPSLIGVLMLIGIVVTNAIVLIDLVNQYRERGMRVVDAIVHGASRRLRPILMTALATIFALLPMAVGLTGHGGFISQPLAIVVIGGLVSSTLLTLVVLPSLYYLVEGAKERREDRRAAQ
ncbi:HAE1 family hydrophobic/amphiphilic exporter-1 [Homoserinimonas aerilata]|uniref:HAE1 family hydrophobic/amphiphilic exporter-1 n=1 Tax=Homoserinimonas aerilata TaxID=1162970 RepID=A0A542XXH3_9MICO|nr:efflux RND transporter permease subunit [Homoserinimonas aerilata]TQL40433.1 HAE1 family hydrophobic/amphiphilic exporter-1 [Homoserinimonas aerilata]